MAGAVFPLVFRREVHMPRLLTLILLIAIIHSCAAIFEKDWDEETNSIHYRITKIESEFDQPDSVKGIEVISVAVDKEISDSTGDSTFSIYLYFVSTKGIGAEPGDTLRVQIDSQWTSLCCVKEWHDHVPLKDVAYNNPRALGWVWIKKSIFEVKREMIHEMAKSKEVRLEVDTPSRMVVGRISHDGTKSIAKFCKKYVR